MSSMTEVNKPHAVCVPSPFQSHIKAMLQFAQLLHHRGFHITFVNTEFNHRRFLKSHGHNSLDQFPDFKFETIPDGLPSSDENNSQDLTLVMNSLRKHFSAPFRNLLNKLSVNKNLPVTSIVSDGFMPFTVTVAAELEIPIALFFTLAGVGFMSFKLFPTLVEKGFAPLKDESPLTDDFLDTAVDWVPGLKHIRLRDLSGAWRTTNPDDVPFNFFLETAEGAHKVSAVIVHTFEALEPDVLEAFSSSRSMLPPVYAIGPLQLLLNQIPEYPLKSVGYSLWEEETECLQWLTGKAPNSVLYVNFGSMVVMTPQHLMEFAWGLANSKLSFLWVIRPDLVVGESMVVLPPQFVAETKERGLIASWCPQEQVLNHPSVGGFLTHCGWNSIMESISAGVPLLCWPLVADQRINSRYTCYEWGIGMEISNDVKREEVQKLIEELMEGEKGKEVKTKVMMWKKLAEEASSSHGSSAITLDNLVNQVLSKARY
ncbi:7-deoxyloganetin glucosyltransferase-like [Argentina anserina]|uniref:7-deoxyloganetin glucosyltransferase-like n=1 Tax=Argentina anserina TaxID=57926 RepID=UPI002176671F|nr:7-deoxyloganetin glucosyltransferase-like [Potentilla anserina]